jgi:hypothetical protein
MLILVAFEFIGGAQWSDDIYLLWQEGEGKEDGFLALDSPRDGHLVIEKFQSCHPLARVVR